MVNKRLLIILGGICTSFFTTLGHADNLDFSSRSACNSAMRVYSERALELQYQEDDIYGPAAQGFGIMGQFFYNLSENSINRSTQCDANSCIATQIANCQLVGTPAWTRYMASFVSKEVSLLNDKQFDPSLTRGKPTLKCTYPVGAEAAKWDNCTIENNN